MQTVVHAVFANRSHAVSASDALKQAGFRPRDITIIGENASELEKTAAVLESEKQDRLMMTLGMIGTVLGCTSGFLALPHMPAREITYMPIVILIFTYWGLALGLFAAMGVARVHNLKALSPAEANVPFADVQTGDVCLSFDTANDDQEAARARSLAVKHGATDVILEVRNQIPLLNIAAVDDATSAPVLVLGKTA